MIRFVALLILCLVYSCKSDKRYHDQPDQKDAVPQQMVMPREDVSGYIQAMMALRTAKNKAFKSGADSPLRSSQKSGFSGLDYFAIDTAFVVQARLEVEAMPQVAVLPTTTDREQAQLVYGTLYFTLKNTEFQLKVYRDPMLENDPQYKDYLFLPFTDLTNGSETYGGGRYLDLSIPSGSEITVDFNKAYNPYCAYNKKYSCPLVPRENHLDIAVEAGEKKFRLGGTP